MADKKITTHRGRDLLGNLALMSAVWIGYTLVRTITADRFGVAMENAAAVLDFQRAVGLPSELSFQRGLLGSTAIIKAANVYYISVHFPVTVLFLAWVWIRHRDRFARIRNSLIAVTLMGMVLHTVYPLAPPRMIRGFVDTALVFGPNPYDLGIASAANQLAAMPSLHVGWALVVALGIVWIAKSPWRYLALAHPVITALVVIATANHYWTDAIVALLLVGVVWLLATTRTTRIMLRRKSESVPTGS